MKDDHTQYQKIGRRKFLKTALLTGAAVSLTSMTNACSGIENDESLNWNAGRGFDTKTLMQGTHDTEDIYKSWDIDSGMMCWHWDKGNDYPRIKKYPL